ncbi:MAG: hypothetical protein R3E55_08255 [Burkholderiaceae bacterium]
MPWTVYRPAMVVGDKHDRRDGQDRRAVLFFQADPAHAPAAAPVDACRGPGGGRVNIVPVDFVVNAINVISHQKAIGKKCFHLVDPVEATAWAMCWTSSRARRMRRELFAQCGAARVHSEGIRRA